MNEASVYDDGYNRKKSRKRKKKNVDKDKSKSKKDYNKSITEDVTMKTEIKVEADDSYNFLPPAFPEQNAQLENDDQGSSNIITPSDSIVENVKVEEGSDFSEVIDKPVKKKKKHSKSGEPKKIKSKSVNKTKRKHLNISIFDTNEPLDVSDADVQRKLMAMPSLNLHKSSTGNKDAANHLSGNIIFSENEVNTNPIKEKTVINIINSGQTANPTYSDTREAEKITDNTVDDRLNLYTKNVKKSTITMKPTFSKQISLKTISSDQVKPINKIDKAVESEYISEDTKIAIQETKPGTYTTCKSVGTIISERSILNYTKKDIIKAPRLSVLKSAYNITATEVSPKVDTEKSIREENDTHVTPKNVVVSPKTWPITKSREPKLSGSGIMFLNTSFSNPPILQKETIAQELGNEVKTVELSKPIAPCAIQIPQLENFFTKNAILAQPLAQPVTCVSGTNTDIKNLGKRSTTDTSKMMATKFWQPSTSNNNFFFLKDTRDDKQAHSKITNYDTSEASVSSSSLSLKGNNTFFLATTSKCTNISLNPQSSMMIDFNKKYLQTSSSVPNATGSFVKLIPKSQEQLLMKKTINQKEDICSSRKPFKSPGTILSNVKTVSTQVDSPLEAIQLGKNVNITSLDIGTQYTTNHSITDLQDTQKTITISPLQQEQFSNVITVNDKLQTQNILKNMEGIYTGMTPSKQLTSSRRKSKEKLKKATTRKKECIETKILTSTANLEELNSITCSVEQTPSVSHRVTMVPGHISDMLYPSVPNNDLLKAFNDYWSAQISHCAICAPFTSNCNGHGRLMPPDWKYCKPTVLPESSPIWVNNIHLCLKFHISGRNFY